MKRETLELVNNRNVRQDIEVPINPFDSAVGSAMGRRKEDKSIN